MIRGYENSFQVKSKTIKSMSYRDFRMCAYLVIDQKQVEKYRHIPWQAQSKGENRVKGNSVYKNVDDNAQGTKQQTLNVSLLPGTVEGRFLFLNSD